MKSHLRKAKHNEDFLAEFDRLIPDNYFDWKITVHFYIAVHYIDAYFASHGTAIHSHDQRRVAMETHAYPVSQACLDNYDNLYRICRSARYNGFTGIKEYTKYQKDKLKEAKSNLKKIKEFVVADLTEAGEWPI